MAAFLVCNDKIFFLGLVFILFGRCYIQNVWTKVRQVAIFRNDCLWKCASVVGPRQVFDGAVIVLSLAPMVASTVANGPSSPWDAISLIITLRIWRVKRIIDGEAGENLNSVAVFSFNNLHATVTQLKEVQPNLTELKQTQMHIDQPPGPRFPPSLYRLFTIQSNKDIDQPSW